MQRNDIPGDDFVTPYLHPALRYNRVMRRGEDEFAIHVPGGVAVEFERTNSSRSRAGVGFAPSSRNTY